MNYRIYNLLLTIFSPLIIIAYILRIFLTGKERKGMWQRLGFLPELPAGALWVHAVSVGEVVATKGLIDELKKRLPSSPIILSTITDSGQEMAKKIFKLSSPITNGQNLNAIFYLPLDLPSIIKRVVRKISPSILIIMETELWPNLIKEASKSGKVLLINGRISDKSFPKYKRYKSFLTEVLKNVDFLGMQNEKEAEKIKELGAEKSKIKIGGNTKLDFNLTTDLSAPRLKKELGIEEDSLILVAGSTHPGEEESILKVFKVLKKRYPKLLLILAPRHPERAKEVEEKIQNEKLNWIRRSKVKTGLSPVSKEDIILIDTIGELYQLYSLATLVFVGGSLVNIGGHNILEPAVWGKVIIVGPYIYNFQEIFNLLKESGGVFQVKDTEELEAKIDELLKDIPNLWKKGYKVKEMVERNRGASSFYAQEIIRMWR